MKTKLLFLSTVAAALVLSVSCSGASGSSSNDAGSPYLSSLSVSPYSLNETYNQVSTDYTVNVPNSVTQITVAATTADKYAGLAFSPIQPTSLDVGENIITVSVTAPFTASRFVISVLTQYTITVTRAAP